MSSSIGAADGDNHEYVEVGRRTFFRGMTKKASRLFNAAIRKARLAFTDVTPAELMAEAITDRGSRMPDAKALALISRAAFEVDDFWRITHILHRRLSRFNKKCWRKSYNALILLEYLLVNGPNSTASEFQWDTDGLKKLRSLRFNDRNGNWDVAVRSRTERILQLLENERLLREERNNACLLAYESFLQQLDSISSTQERQMEYSTTWEKFDEVQISGQTECIRRNLNINTGQQSSLNKIEKTAILTDPFIRGPHEWDDQLKPLLGSQDG